MSAMTHNPVIKAFADRLRENGKKGKVIVIACVRKMIHIIYAILKKQEAFNSEFNSSNLVIKAA
jgi:transposase